MEYKLWTTIPYFPYPIYICIVGLETSVYRAIPFTMQKNANLVVCYFYIADCFINITWTKYNIGKQRRENLNWNIIMHTITDAQTYIIPYRNDVTMTCSLRTILSNGCFTFGNNTFCTFTCKQRWR